MMQHEITQAAGAHTRRKRRGRGEASGLGKTAGRGHKGSQSRAGSGFHPLREGGQMPIFRRIPKRGFSNYNFRTVNEIVTLRDLNRAFESGARADLEALRAARLVRHDGAPVKILATGSIDKKLAVVVHACSPKARAAIEQAGGSVELIERPDPAARAKAKRNQAPEPKARRQRPSRLEKKKAARA